MEILVCVKRVPDTSENEIQVNPAGDDIERDDLVYSVNEPDNYAVEEALQIAGRVGGNVTVVTVGSDEDEEVLRRQMAMGANRGVLITDGFHDVDGRGIAEVLKAFVQDGGYDLILTGVQADDGCAQVGGMLAALLDYPFASIVTSIETLDGGKLKIAREVEGGNKDVHIIDLPCVLSIQTGINEPRYVGMRGIRQVASVPIPRVQAAALSSPRVMRIDYFVPAAGKGAEMLSGSREEIAGKVFELVKSKGGLN